MQLPEAAAAYIRAGFYWEARELPRPQALPPNQNAAPVLISAINWKTWNSKSLDLIVAMVRRGYFLRAEAALKSMNVVLDQIAAASKLPHLDYARDWDDPMNMDFTGLRCIKGAVRALCCRGELEARTGHLSKSVLDMKSALRLTKLMGDDTAMISIMQQISCSKLILRSLQHCAAANHTNSGYLQSLLNLLTLTLITPNYEGALKTEAFLQLASLRNLPISYLDGLQIDSELKPPLMHKKHLKHSGYPDSIKSRAEPQLIREVWTLVGIHFSSLKGDPIGLESSLSPQKKSRPAHRCELLPCEYIFPVFAQAGVVVVELQAREICTAAVLEGLLIRSKTGHFPMSLQEMPGTWIDPFTKVPLRLRVSGETFRVYSVGQDLHDDGGVDPMEREEHKYEHKDVAVAYPPIEPVPSEHSSYSGSRD